VGQFAFTGIEFNQTFDQEVKSYYTIVNAFVYGLIEEKCEQATLKISYKLTILFNGMAVKRYAPLDEFRKKLKSKSN
jgi:hypothetical protein